MSAIDLDAGRAARLEAIGEGAKVTLLGVTFTVPHPKLWAIEATALMQQGKIDAALALLVGLDVYRELEQAGLNVSDVEAVFAAVASDQGLTPGE